MPDEQTISERAKQNGGGADGALRGRLGSIGDIGRVGSGLARASSEFARAGRRLAGALADAGQEATSSTAERVARELRARLTAGLHHREPEHLPGRRPPLL